MTRANTRRRSRKTEAFPIVGIGASAGGLDAFKNFFQAMPANSGAAFVLIQHLDPTRESLIGDLVGTYTSMKVVQAADGMPVEANQIYVIPPNAYLSLANRLLRLSPPTAPRSLRMAVDFFFHSLARDQQDSAVGIILSGTGTDGTLGLKSIKAAGGMTMVQDPDTVQHDGMPRSAIASADFVLPAEQMAEVLLDYIRNVTARPNTLALPVGESSDPLAAVLDVLRSHRKFDFSGYKKGTLQRRIQRRMSLRHIQRLSSYVETLRADPGEVTALFRDLLINVTSFFRDPPAWQILQERVIRPLVAGKEGGLPLRVWIPACSTGEEAYSLVILLIEEMEATGKPHPLQVFASDVDSEALDTARAGVFPEGIAAHVSARRLARFFTKFEHSFHANKELRDTIVFAQQSLLSDPPFSRLDLISCRNLFIYLEPPAQERLFPSLHFGLLRGGCLFLGSADGLGPHTDLFEPISSKWRIYRRIGPTRPDRLHLPLVKGGRNLVTGGTNLEQLPPGRLGALAQQILLQRYAPACVIINRAGEVVYFHGRTDDYLRQPSGLPTRDLIAQARSGLRATLRAAIDRAIRDDHRIVVPGIQVRRGSAFPRVKITVDLLDAKAPPADRLWLVALEDEAEVSSSPPSTTDLAVREFDDNSIHRLEFELKGMEEELQQTIEDLKAANEELLSINEEFQSSNEELETSKEELQSVNEELTTANSQLQSKIEEVEATSNDLDNLLTSTNIATLFLDTKMRIRRFTPAATRLFSLIPSDIGRPIQDIVQKFADPDLLRDATAVLQQPSTPKTEVKGHDGRWYVRQILPYRTRDGRCEGLVMTFSDVAAEALHEARLYAESIVDTVRESLLVLDADLRVCSANQSFYRAFDVTEEETVGHLLPTLGRGEWNIPKLRTLLLEALSRQGSLSDLEITGRNPSGAPRILNLNARAIERTGAPLHLILLAIEDVTSRKLAQDELRESETRKRGEEQVRLRQAELARAQRLSTVGELATGLAHELNQPLSAIANGVDACARYVRSGMSDTGKLLTLLDDASAEAVRAGSIIEHLRHFIEKGKPQFEDADLRKIARTVARLLARELEHEHINLRVKVPARPVLIHADRVQIEQIAVNLIQNAIDAIRDAPAGRRQIDLEVSASDQMAEVAVRDSGTGLPDGVTEQMFDPFFTTKPHGLGMGLAICRSIVEAHNGRIWAKHRADRTNGTTIRFTLPLTTTSSPSEKEGLL